MVVCECLSSLLLLVSWRWYNCINFSNTAKHERRNTPRCENVAVSLAQSLSTCFIPLSPRWILTLLNRSVVIFFLFVSCFVSHAFIGKWSPKSNSARFSEKIPYISERFRGSASYDREWFNGRGKGIYEERSFTFSLLFSLNKIYICLGWINCLRDIWSLLHSFKSRLWYEIIEKNICSSTGNMSQCYHGTALTKGKLYRRLRPTRMISFLRKRRKCKRERWWPLDLRSFKVKNIKKTSLLSIQTSSYTTVVFTYQLSKPNKERATSEPDKEFKKVSTTAVYTEFTIPNRDQCAFSPYCILYISHRNVTENLFNSLIRAPFFGDHFCYCHDHNVWFGSDAVRRKLWAACYS